MKPGYSLLELTIGIFLASLLAISLFQSVRTTTRTVELADDIMDLDIRVATFHHQFERDTIGIFVLEKNDSSQQGKQANAEAAQQSGDTENITQKPQETKPETTQKQEKFPDTLFYGINNDEGRLTEFTCITTNPVRVYEKAANVTVKPRMVRVMYRLLADPMHQNSFTLFRQESDDLKIAAVNPKAEKPVRGYALLSNIKKMSLEYVYPVKKEAEKTENASTASPEVQKFITRTDWPFKAAQEAQEKNVPPYPQIITVKFELWDDTRIKMAN